MEKAKKRSFNSDDETNKLSEWQYVCPVVMKARARGGRKLLSGVCRPRRTHHRPRRSIWGRYRALPVGLVVPWVLAVLARHCFLVGLGVLEVRGFLAVQHHRRDLGLRRLLADLVVQLLLAVLALLGWRGSIGLDVRGLREVRRFLADQLGLVVLVVPGVREVRRFLGVLAVLDGLGLLALRLGLVVLALPEGMAGRVARWGPRRRGVGGLGILGHLGRLGVLACRWLRACRRGLGLLAGSILGNRRPDA